MTRRWTLVGAIAPVVLITACGGDDGSGGASGDFSIAALLDEVPTSVADEYDDGFDIWAADLDAAGEAAEMSRPGEGGDEFRAWLLRITGFPAPDSDEPPLTAALLPSTLQDNVAQSDEIDGEVGWSLVDVQQFVEFGPPPQSFSVLHGAFEEADLDDAMGERTDDIWRLGSDEDGERQMDDVTVLRRTGESLRLALDDDALAMSQFTPPVEEWLTGDAETLADDAPLVDVAEALDDADVYSAALTTRAAPFTAAFPGMSQEQIEALIDEFGEDGFLEPFDVVGLGLSVVDDRPTMTMVHHFGDEDAAEENADRLDALLTAGVSLIDRAPLTDRFDDHDVVADGELVVSTVTLADDTPPTIAWKMFQSREVFFVHG